MNEQCCQDCKAAYGEDVAQISMNLRRAQWLLICPEDGLLCANCIVKRAARLPNVICVQARIIFGDDSEKVEVEYAPELWRLTTVLHANRCHPDFSYTVVPIQSAVQIREILLAGDGWELNPEADVAPGDESWRRRKAP